MEELLEVSYAELRRLAANYLSGGASYQTLRPTALINEAYLKLHKHGPWRNRAHFVGTAAMAMRHFLASYYESKKAQKRAGGLAVELENVLLAGTGNVVEWLELKQIFDRLEEFSEIVCRVMEARFLGGMTIEETGEFLRLSPATVKRHLKLGQAFMARELQRKPTPGSAEEILL